MKANQKLMIPNFPYQKNIKYGEALNGKSIANRRFAPSYAYIKPSYHQIKNMY